MRWIGIPYRDRGRAFDGCDCWGLVMLWYRHELGLVLPDYGETYSSSDDVTDAARAVTENAEDSIWGQVPWDMARKGDIVVLRLMGFPCHVGVVLAPGRMLHILRSHASILERYDGAIYRGRLVGLYRAGDGTLPAADPG